MAINEKYSYLTEELFQAWQGGDSTARNIFYEAIFDYYWPVITKKLGEKFIRYDDTVNVFSEEQAAAMDIIEKEFDFFENKHLNNKEKFIGWRDPGQFFGYLWKNRLVRLIYDYWQDKPKRPISGDEPIYLDDENETSILDQQISGDFDPVDEVANEDLKQQLIQWILNNKDRVSVTNWLTLGAYCVALTEGYNNQGKGKHEFNARVAELMGIPVGNQLRTRINHMLNQIRDIMKDTGDWEQFRYFFEDSDDENGGEDENG
ncbi:MAG: hypothetical protein R6U89_02490 [Dehalococcoidia bacterium]